MQSCGVCGATGIDANGYCTNCRAYRGLLLPAPPSAPASHAGYEMMNQSSGGPYLSPSNASPHAEPSTAQPYSSNPAAGYQQPAPTGGRNSFAVPLVALSTTLIVLVVAIVTVVVVRSGGTKGSPNPANTGTTLVDSCVVGNWTQTSHTEVQSSPQLVGPVTLTGGGATLHMKADGSGILDYGNGTTYSGTGTLAASGASVQITLKATGTISFDYRTNNGAISLSNMVSKATVTPITDGQPASATQVQPNSAPSNYTCTSTHLTMTDELTTTEYRHTG
jgi:hypothetical protein